MGELGILLSRFTDLYDQESAFFYKIETQKKSSQSLIGVEIICLHSLCFLLFFEMCRTNSNLQISHVKADPKVKCFDSQLIRATISPYICLRNDTIIEYFVH